MNKTIAHSSKNEMFWYIIERSVVCRNSENLSSLQTGRLKQRLKSTEANIFLYIKEAPADLECSMLLQIAARCSCVHQSNTFDSIKQSISCSLLHASAIPE